MRFQYPDYLKSLQQHISTFMNPEDQQVAMRTAAKRLARHHGQISKYDGQGNKRAGFPVAGDTGGRTALPYLVITCSAMQDKCADERRQAKAYRLRAEERRREAAFVASSGPSRKMIVDRVDGGNGP